MHLNFAKQKPNKAIIIGENQYQCCNFENETEKNYTKIILKVLIELTHEHGKIDAPIGRDSKDRQKMAVTENNSKRAVTNFTVIERFTDMCLVECRLETGRTHQIRVHLGYIGYPVYGDPKYGKRKDDQSHGQYLHAKILGFVHPTTNEYMEFDSDLPDYFETKIEELEEEMEHE